MNLYVNQSIVIHSLKVAGVSNSAVLQIGTAGIIKTHAQSYNTGGFKGPAPQLKLPEQELLFPLLPPQKIDQ